MTSIEVKCMMRKIYVAITKRGSERLRPPDVGMVTQTSASPHLKVLPTPPLRHHHCDIAEGLKRGS